MYTMILLDGHNSTIHTKDNFKNVLFDIKAKHRFEAFPPKEGSSMVIFNEQTDYNITKEIRQVKEIDDNKFYVRTLDNNYIIIKDELGLGDKVEKIIEVIIPNSILKKIKEEDCGCSKRKEYLNNINGIFK